MIQYTLLIILIIDSNRLRWNMRIGEFSEKHKITHDTVRHYINMGLLIPKKDGHHFRFDFSHDEDIEEIIRLKKLDFSLNEIQRILNLKRVAGKNSKEYRDYYKEFLEDKKKQIIQLEKRYGHVKSELEDKILDLETRGKNQETKLGININSLEILHCPSCEKILKISDGIIENNMIIKARISCSCSYRASIRDGTYIGSTCEDSSLKRKEIPSKLDFLEHSSNDFINFFYDGMSEMMHQIQEKNISPTYVLELENCSGTFLMQHIEKLHRDTTYIVVNNDKSRLDKLKTSLELHSKHENFIFICEEYDRLPLKSNSIDMAIDHWMTKDYFISHRGFLMDKIHKHLKVQGLLIGSYPYLRSLHSDSPLAESKEQGYFEVDFLSREFKSLGFEEDTHLLLGPLVDENPYNPDLKDKRLYSNITSWIKRDL